MKRICSLIFIACAFNASAQEISSRFELVKMEKNVNTFHHEAAPVVTPNGNTLYFFVQDHPDNTYGKDDSQDIWMSKKDENGVWGDAQHLSSPFNIHHSNQVFTVFNDGSLFIRGGRSKNSKGFSMVSSGGSLTELEVRDFKKMNKGRFYGASMSEDRKHIILYFSERENSTSSDLYSSHLEPNGSYSVPSKLPLSTSADDLGPFIGPDQKTLYFSSARLGEGRQGGTDIYKTTRMDESWTNWSSPINMGKPINTGALDFYFTIDKNGNVFTSRANKALEGAQLDLYMLVPKEMHVRLEGYVYNDKTNQPVSANVELRLKEKDPLALTSDVNGKFVSNFLEVEEYAVVTNASGFLSKQQSFKLPLLYSDTTISLEIPLTPIAKKLMLRGNVYDKKTEMPVAAKIVLASMRSAKPVSSTMEASNGKFEQALPRLGWYLLTASAEGYLNSTDSVALDDEELSPVTKNIYLEPIEVGVTVRLKNIYFDFDRATLKSESFVELDKVVDFLKQNKTVEVEIAGHTDAKGSDDYNLNLSQGRSQSVVDYIISQGIDASRLVAHGYGESKPIDTNDTPEGQANNRRVEFTIVKK